MRRAACVVATGQAAAALTHSAPKPRTRQERAPFGGTPHGRDAYAVTDAGAHSGSGDGNVPFTATSTCDQAGSENTVSAPSKLASPE